MSSLDLFKSRHSDLGIAWLFATLGRRNKVRTLSKKAISNVDIRAACRFIVSPDHRAPLRISSQLMAGLARVYVSQAETWMSDVTMVHASIRRMALSSSLATTDAIDLPTGARTVRKDAITMKPSGIPLVLFEFERAVDVPPQITGAKCSEAQNEVGGEPGVHRSHRKHTVSQDKITLPPHATGSPLDGDLPGESLLFDSDIGAGMMDWAPSQEQFGLNLGLFADDGELAAIERDFSSGQVLDASNPVPSHNLLEPLVSNNSLSTSTNGFNDGGGFDMNNDDLPPLNDMPPLDPANIAWPEETPFPRPVEEQASNERMSQDQGDAAATWEDPNIGRAQKRRRVMGPAKEAGPLVDATIEVPETILMQWNEQYGQNMVRLTEEAQSKIADKAAVAVSQPYLDGVYDFLTQGRSILAAAWADINGQARFNSERDLRLPRSKLPGDTAFAPLGAAQPGMGQINQFGTNINSLPSLDNAGKIGNMQPLFGPNDDMPLEDGPLLMMDVGAGETSGFSTSGMGVGRDSGSGGTRGRDMLPWNMPSMFERVGSEVPASLSGTPSRSNQHGMPWFGSHSNPSLPRPESILGNDLAPDGSLLGTRASELNDLGGDLTASMRPTEEKKSQMLQRATEEEDNFIKYVLAISRNLPAGAPGPNKGAGTRSLFFNDVAPVAEANTSIAAQAFYHVLASVTAGKMTVHQREPYAELVLTLPDPDMDHSVPATPLFFSRGATGSASPRVRNTVRSRSGSHYTSGSGGQRRPQSRDASLSAYLSVPSPGTVA